MGGKNPAVDDLVNLLALHDACHRWAHDHPTAARDLGWIVGQWGVPAAVPVVVRRHP
jgi:hypothetical protein